MSDRRGISRATTVAAVAVAGAATLAWRKARTRQRRPAADALSTARRLNRASGLLAASVLSDSALEHYRGSFHNKTMLAPLVSAAASLAGGAHGTGDPTAGAHRARNAVSALALVTGIVGMGFHWYNIAKRTGGLSMQNLFYAAPIGAPAALSLAGIIGAAAERLRDVPAGTRPRILGLPADRALAALASLGLLGTAGEAGLLHFRGAFQNPAMFLPVSIPPVAAMLLARQALQSPTRREPRLLRWWLRATAWLGFLGCAFHVYGVSRGMGGFKNWSQNLLDGPPIPAPPSFTALALVGLTALNLQEEDFHER